MVTRNQQPGSRAVDTLSVIGLHCATSVVPISFLLFSVKSVTVCNSSGMTRVLQYLTVKIQGGK